MRLFDLLVVELLPIMLFEPFDIEPFDMLLIEPLDAPIAASLPVMVLPFGVVADMLLFGLMLLLGGIAPVDGLAALGLIPLPVGADEPELAPPGADMPDPPAPVDPVEPAEPEPPVLCASAIAGIEAATSAVNRILRMDALLETMTITGGQRATMQIGCAAKRATGSIYLFN